MLFFQTQVLKKAVEMLLCLQTHYSHHEWGLSVAIAQWSLRHWLARFVGGAEGEKTGDIIGVIGTRVVRVK